MLKQVKHFFINRDRYTGDFSLWEKPLNEFMRRKDLVVEDIKTVPVDAYDAYIAVVVFTPLEGFRQDS